MNRLLFVAVCALLEISRASARPNDAEMESQDVSQTPLLIADPRYEELLKEAENIVKKAIKKVRVETKSLMTKMRSTADLAEATFGSRACNEEAKKILAELKDDMFKSLPECPERIKLEQETWALGISASLLMGQIGQAAKDSLELCLKQKRSKNVICIINPEDEESKKFETLKRKVDELAEMATKMHTDIFLPFVEKCYDQEKLKSNVETIKANCPEA